MGGKNTKFISNTLQVECQKQITKLDNLARDLGVTVDKVHAIAAQALNQLKDYSTNPDVEEQSDRNFSEFNLLKEVYDTIETNLCEKKLDFIKEMSEFAAWLKSKYKLNDFQALENLAIDEYLNNPKKNIGDGKKGKQVSVTKQSSVDKEFEKTEVSDLYQRLADIDQESKLEQERIIMLLNEKMAENNTLALQLEELTAFKRRNAILAKEVEHLQNELQKYKPHVAKGQEQQNQKCNQQSDKPTTDTEFDCIDGESKTPENQLVVSKDTIPVQVFFRKKGELTSEIAVNLTSLLSERFKVGKPRVQIIERQTTDDIEESQLLFVICLHGSRLGTDAANEIQGIKDFARTALLIFHHKDEHALPNQTSDRVLTEPKYKDLGGIFDFAFLKGKGIYQCQMNTLTTNKVVDFILGAQK